MLGSSRTFSRSAASATWQAQARAAPVGDVLRGAIAGKGDERARQRLRRRLRQLVHHIQPALVRAHVLRRISANYEVSAPVWNVFVHIAASPGSTWHLHNCRCDSQVESGGHCRTFEAGHSGEERSICHAGSRQCSAGSSSVLQALEAHRTGALQRAAAERQVQQAANDVALPVGLPKLLPQPLVHLRRI